MRRPFSFNSPHGTRQASDSDLSGCRALIIDTNQNSRSILRSMLADLGLQSIAQAPKVSDARKLLETRPFDVVLCDYHFDDSDMSGADLLDDLRRAQLLPYSTVFVMVTAEASYVKVAEAAESALDCYLLKPHNLNSLAQRLHLARHRKAVLASIFEAIEQEDFDVAAELCLARFHQRGEFWIYAARIGGELLLRLSRHDEARTLFQAIDETRALPWARLGIARAQLEGGLPHPARQTLESLIGEHPAYADAHDVMGRTQLQAGQFEEALATYQRAVEITPSSIGRLQKVGMLAYYMGMTDEATRALERATTLGVSSRMFDFQSLVMLAQIRFEQKDPKGVQRCQGTLVHALEKMPDNVRLQRMSHVVRVLDLMLQRQIGEVVRLIKEMAQTCKQTDYDFEAAGNMLCLLSCLRANELQLPDAESWVQQIAQRFCTSKASTDLLILTVRRHPPYEEIIRLAYKSVGDTAEKVLTHAKAGSPGAAVKALLVQGAQTCNAKLLDLTDLVLNRYRDQIDNANDLSALIQDLRNKYCHQSLHVQLGASTGRPSGGLKLRS